MLYTFINYLFALIVICHQWLAPYEPNYNHREFFISSKTNEDLVKRLSELPEKSVLKFRSSGGASNSAIQAATIIWRKEIDVIINDMCTSACVEFILPSAKSLIFKDEPLVGVHGNPLMSEYIVNSYFPDQSYSCQMRSIEMTREFYNKIGYSQEVWKAQLKHLGLKAPKFKTSKGCQVFWNSGYEYDYWYPTSSQLRNIFELSFSGTVCADNPRCYRQRISFYWPRGVKVKVGNQVYISEGRLKSIFILPFIK